MRYSEQLLHPTPNIVYCRWNRIQQRNVIEQSQRKDDPTIASACLSVYSSLLAYQPLKCSAGQQLDAHVQRLLVLRFLQ